MAALQLTITAPVSGAGVPAMIPVSGLVDPADNVTVTGWLDAAGSGAAQVVTVSANSVSPPPNWQMSIPLPGGLPAGTYFNVHVRATKLCPLTNLPSTVVDQVPVHT